MLACIDHPELSGAIRQESSEILAHVGLLEFLLGALAIVLIEHRMPAVIVAWPLAPVNCAMCDTVEVL
ncbi:MAG: hypothetical protein ACJ8R9_22000 [Steroidobacteraceae bacterium]